jgi:hypothetical protein
MSCFWTGLIGALQRYRRIRPGMSSRELVQWLKANNRLTPSVRWQGEPLSEQLQRENFERIRLHNVDDVNNGYETGSADPFLFLVAEMFKIDIEHQMMGYNAQYTTIWYTTAPEKSTLDRLRFQSSMGHFRQR